MDPRERPRPEAFLDHRDYLRAMVRHLKVTLPAFSYRYFSKKAGFRSTNILKLVMDGERNLTARSIPKFARGLKLDEHEAELFEALVRFSQARDDATRNHYFKRLRRGGPNGAIARLESDQYDLYSLWYVLPVRELMGQPDFREDPEWIAVRLRPPIRPREAEEALRLLERLGQIERVDGRLRPAATKQSTVAEIVKQGLPVRNWHREMLRLAARAVEGVSRDERNVSALTISLDRRQYEAVCERIATFRRELLEMVDEQPRDGAQREVYQIMFAAFPVTGEVGR